ncbi:MAG: nucleoside-triphosphatase [Thermoplasmata archaeon]
MKSKNIFITGNPRCGKSTLVREVAAECGMTVAGLSTPEMRRNGKRVGFALEDIMTGEKGVLAHVDVDEGPRVGKYGVCTEELDQFTELSLKDLPDDVELVVIDEIGKMEMFSEEFKDAVDTLLSSKTPVLAVLHRHLIDRYASRGKLYTLEDNFDQVKKQVTEDIG